MTSIQYLVSSLSYTIKKGIMEKCIIISYSLLKKKKKAWKPFCSFKIKPCGIIVSVKPVSLVLFGCAILLFYISLVFMQHHTRCIIKQLCIKFLFQSML